MTRADDSAGDLLLYTDPISPNARRVSMFIAEKNIDLPTRSINPSDGTLQSPEYLAKNPLGQIPLLEGAEGFFLAESMSICRYLDERFPEPNLFGREFEERAIIHMWARRAELALFNPSVELGHHAHPMFRDHFDQIPAYAALNRTMIERSYAILDSQLQESRFVAGSRFSAADIVTYSGVELAGVWRCAPAPSLESLSRWKSEIDQRPSAEITRYSVPA